MEKTPLPKRRRLNGYNSNKPFKSPIQTPLRSKDNVIQPSPLQQVAQNQQSDESTPESSFDSAIQLPKRTPISSTLSTRPVIRPICSFRPQSSSACPTPEERQLIVENRRLEREALTVKQDIDALTQAISLITKDSDTKLAELEQKWRTAARLAAEELFTTAKEKVSRMGGVGALKDQEQEARQRAIDRHQDEMAERKREMEAAMAAEDEEDEDDDEDADPNRERPIRDKWEYDTRELEYNEEEHSNLEDPGPSELQTSSYNDDDTYSMDMMLRSMGIDFALIGYSKEHQRWVG